VISPFFIEPVYTFPHIPLVDNHHLATLTNITSLCELPHTKPAPTTCIFALFFLENDGLGWFQKILFQEVRNNNASLKKIEQ